MYLLKGKGYCPRVEDIKGKSKDFAPARCMTITHSVNGDLINGIEENQPVSPGKTVLYQDHNKNQIEIVIESVVFGYMWGLNSGYCMIQFGLPTKSAQNDSDEYSKLRELWFEGNLCLHNNTGDETKLNEALNILDPEYGKVEGLGDYYMKGLISIKDPMVYCLLSVTEFLSKME